MFAAQVTVSFHCQCATVAMAKPATHGENIYTRLNAAGGEQVKQK
jgi:hypothetical protein